MIEKIQERDGGPAFPYSHKELAPFGKEVGSGGMTLRDWFAGMALQGMLANVDTGKHKIEKPGTFTGTLAECAYFVADAMLKAREE